MSNLVSIITPAYNAEKYIRDSIESVKSQDYTNWEMLIVDDCSKDNTRHIVQKYSKDDNRIKLISLGKNGGVANARNTALKLAKGKYVAFLDSDDLWYPNKLSRQIAFMEENNYHFTFSDYDLIDDEGKPFNKIIKAPSIVKYERLLKGNPIGCLTVIIDKERVGNFRMPNIGHEDYATWLNIIKDGITAYGINESLAMYRKADNSLSSNKFKAVRWTWNIYREHQNLSLLRSIRCLVAYMANATLKYLTI